MNPLRAFYKDEQTREALKEFLNKNLEEMALEAVFRKEDTKGFPEAKELISKTFNSLANLYEEPEKVTYESPR